MTERRDKICHFFYPQKRKDPEKNLSEVGSSPFKKPRPDGDPPLPEEAPHENMPRALPRLSYLLLAPEEGCNVPRTLNQLESDLELPILGLRDTFEAWVVLDCPRFIEQSTMFRVFDEYNTAYKMKLHLIRINNVRIEPCFSFGWARFVNNHILGAGDQISFNKNLDTTISDDFYYILKYVKKPESSENPGDGAESSRKQDDGAESSTKLSDAGAESSKNTCDTTESRTILSDDSVQSELGIGMPVFKVIYHRVLLETPPAQEQRIALGPGSRPFQLAAICLSKTLTAAEVGPRLFFDVYDAIILADNPRVAETLPGDISVEFVVYDRDDRRYDMTLLHYVQRGGIIGFCLDGWDRFIMNHDLNQGDRVAFYKFLDRRIHYGYYYVVLKLPADVDCQNRRNLIRPGSRALTPESHCFSKILSQNEVSPGNSGLPLDALQARHFESSSRSLNETFLVFDGDDRQYEMKLTYFFNRVRGMMCFLDNAGWQLFVEHHNLNKGDTIHVNTIFDQSVCDDPYFIITYTRH